ncbi:hypothetical protein JCGZ_22054 [Jatropha curcas]|uniref:Uncharacterized protein n=1 Tax=Jatropha curcas TaxID=180498 RepID=A0A067LJ14_JATCU|nr:hypothetical protein JCGZ_22054 [Jatropha curcas]
MEVAIDSFGDAGHGSNLPSLRSDFQRRGSSSLAPTALLFDFRANLVNLVDFRCRGWSRSTPLLHTNLSPPPICNFA